MSFRSNHGFKFRRLFRPNLGRRLEGLHDVSSLEDLFDQIMVSNLEGRFDQIMVSSLEGVFDKIMDSSLEGLFDQIIFQVETVFSTKSWFQVLEGLVDQIMASS